MKILKQFLPMIILFVLVAGCKGGGGSAASPFAKPNSADGYTLTVSGGTLNDGTGTDGLVVVATLRDEQGYGPALPWSVEITGPGIAANAPLLFDYQDGRPGSFQICEWAGFNPMTGIYRATAKNFNGTATMYYDFQITATNRISRSLPSTTSNAGSTVLSWSTIPGAQSYTYEIYPASGPSLFGVTTATSVSLGSLANGDYLVYLSAYSADIVALDASRQASPSLPAQTNISEYVFSFPVGGDQASSNYSLASAGGVLDYGFRGPGGAPIYGLSIWTSILYLPPNPDGAPSGDWNVHVTDPNGRVLQFIYPSGNQHYAYWFYDVEPVVGTYTVTASYGTAAKTASFSLSGLTPGLSLPSGMSAAKQTNNDILISWNTVTNANSYYVSLWADIWNNSTKQYDYTEVWGDWASSASRTITSGSIPSGLSCYAYVTAHEVDMTAVTQPVPLPSRADMSENYYGYELPFTTP